MGVSKAEGIKINDFEILIYDMIGLKNISYRGENVNEDWSVPI